MSRSEAEKESLKNLRTKKTKLAIAQVNFWEARETHELRFGDSDLAKKIKEKKTDPRRAKREKAKRQRENAKKNDASAGKKPVEKEVKTKAKVKKVAKVIPKKTKGVSSPVRAGGEDWNVETDCKGNEIHGDGCKGSTDANKVRAKADTRHEGKMYPTCKACKIHIAKRRREERELQAHEKEAQPQPMEVDDEEEENNHSLNGEEEEEEDQANMEEDQDE